MTGDRQTLAGIPEAEIVIGCTGNLLAVVDHLLAAIAQGRHGANVPVEAGAL